MLNMHAYNYISGVAKDSTRCMNADIHTQILQHSLLL